MTTTPALLALALTLTQTGPGGTAGSSEVPEGGSLRGSGGVELSAGPWWGGRQAPRADGFVTLEPHVAVQAQGAIELEVGATLRARVTDAQPENRSADFAGGLLRGEDWDERSDFGQLLRWLRVGDEASFFELRAGAFSAYTLGHGQLVSRYANRVSPDYHPASAALTVHVGPTRTELFASDVLAARVFGGELSLDLGRTFSKDAATWDRHHVALQVVHDFGRTALSTPALTLIWLEADAGLVRASGIQLSLFGGVGGAVRDGSSLGATLGAALDGQPGEVRIGGKLELRKHHSGFRPGMIGYDFELMRYSEIGLARPGLASASYPDGFSGRAEVSLGLGTLDTRHRFTFTAAAERFNWGRTDVEGSLALFVLDGRGTLAVRASAVGLGVDTRLLAGGEARYRFVPSLYAVAYGGTTFFPQADGTLSPGGYAGVGVGADFNG